MYLMCCVHPCSVFPLSDPGLDTSSVFVVVSVPQELLEGGALLATHHTVQLHLIHLEGHMVVLHHTH